MVNAHERHPAGAERATLPAHERARLADRRPAALPIPTRHATCVGALAPQALPGTCPGAGSTGSVSPRKRSGAPVSSRTPRPAVAAGIRVEHRHPAGMHPKITQEYGRRLAVLDRPAGRSPGRKSSVEDPDVRMADVPAQPPGAGRY